MQKEFTIDPSQAATWIHALKKELALPSWLLSALTLIQDAKTKKKVIVSIRIVDE